MLEMEISFFRALSFIIPGNQAGHMNITNAVVQHMFSIQDKITGVMAIPMPFLNCIEIVKMKGGSWATQVKIFTAANLYK